MARRVGSGIEFNPAKNAANIAKHGIALSRASEFMPELVLLDTRKDYGEPRWRGFGLIGTVAYCLAFTVRHNSDGTERVRAISLRRATRKEIERYGIKTK
jgi:uncharacterized DUF497 family protein